MSEPLLELTGLGVDFAVSGGTGHAVRGVDLTVGRGEVVGIVGESGSGKSATMLALLEADPILAAAFRHHIVHFLATRRLLTFFTDSGILPGTGFFSEWWRILGNRLLPEAHDERRLKDCLHLIFDRPNDWRLAAWLRCSRRRWCLDCRGSFWLCRAC